MARPTRYDADYFPFYAKDGKTLGILSNLYGLAGIGFFTNVMRLLTTTPEHHLRLAHDIDRLYIFSKIGCDTETGERMAETMVSTGKLHDRLWHEAHVIYSQDLVDSLASLYSKRKIVPVTGDLLEERYLHGDVPKQGAVTYTPPPAERQSFSQSLRRRMFEKDGGICRYCGVDLDVHNFDVEHLTPVCRGGSDEESNLGISCKRCNSAKGTMTETEFREFIRSVNAVSGDAKDDDSDGNTQSKAKHSKGKQSRAEHRGGGWRFLFVAPAKSSEHGEHPQPRGIRSPGRQRTGESEVRRSARRVRAGDREAAGEEEAETARAARSL